MGKGAKGGFPEVMYKVLRVNVEVERGSTFTFTRDLSCIASIIFTHVNFTRVRM